jgi:hypothetical protein
LKQANRIGFPCLLKASERSGREIIKKVGSEEECKNAFEQIRTEVAGSPIFVKQNSSAKIFVRPEQWGWVMEAVREMELKKSHVIVAEKFKKLVERSVKEITQSRSRPKLMREPRQLEVREGAPKPEVANYGDLGKGTESTRERTPGVRGWVAHLRDRLLRGVHQWSRTCPEGLELVATCTFYSVKPAPPGTCSVVQSSDRGGRIMNSRLNRWSRRNLAARAKQLAGFDARTDDFAPSSRFPDTESIDSIYGQYEQQARPVPPGPPSAQPQVHLDPSSADYFMQSTWTSQYNVTWTWHQNVQTMHYEQIVETSVRVAVPGSLPVSVPSHGYMAHRMQDQQLHVGHLSLEHIAHDSLPLTYAPAGQQTEGGTMAALQALNIDD